MPENTSKRSDAYCNASDNFISFCADLLALGVIGFILGLPIKFLWNYQIGSMFNLNDITYLQAVALVFFVNLLNPIRFNNRKKESK